MNDCVISINIGQVETRRCTRKNSVALQEAICVRIHVAEAPVYGIHEISHMLWIFDDGFST